MKEEYAYKKASLPNNKKEDFATKDPNLDIICRISLKKAPNEEYEKLAKEKEKEYSSRNFFIELVAGKNTPDGEILTSDWLLYYQKSDGKLIEFGFVDVPDDALVFFKQDLGVTF